MRCMTLKRCPDIGLFVRYLSLSLEAKAFVLHTESKKTPSHHVE